MQACTIDGGYGLDLGPPQPQLVSGRNPHGTPYVQRLIERADARRHQGPARVQPRQLVCAICTREFSYDYRGGQLPKYCSPECHHLAKRNHERAFAARRKAAKHAHEGRSLTAHPP